MMRKILIFSILTLVGFGAFLAWYDARYSMDFAPAYEVNHPTSEKSILIATQGSEYKDVVVEKVVEQFRQGDTYISVVDVSLLPEVDPANWDAILILHTWEIWEPEPNAAAFIKRAYERGNICVLSTSGDGNHHIEGVDAITSASRMSTIDDDVIRINSWLNSVMK